jgi:hypothetical protein
MGNKFKSYSPAEANAPILSSAWNKNIEANEDRFTNHDHTSTDEHDGRKIGLNALDDDVQNKLNEYDNLLTRLEELESRVENLEQGGLNNTPKVTGVSKTSVFRNEKITIYGENFDPEPSNNAVIFKGRGGETEAFGEEGSTVNQLIVTVPEDAKTGIIIVKVNGQPAEIEGDPIKITVKQLPIPS